jgi:phosphoribosylaminoimidazolecarboxamide formyltransferase/IMP cyclohydrolase
MGSVRIQRAIVSVSDKTGVVDLAHGLAALGVEVLSTGGTLAALSDAGVPAGSIEGYTGSPEVMEGRVKTLHPLVHGGILARRGRDEADLARLGAAPIDLVVCNLYPFEATVARGAGWEETVENIDIGGPSMLRSAAKNHAFVAVVCDPADYDAVLAELGREGALGVETRRRLAAKAFAHTAAYDGAIAAYLSRAEDGWPGYLTLALEKVDALRYGENPHQRGAFYRERGARAPRLGLGRDLGAGGKELSFNNLVDLEAAVAAVSELDRPAAVVVKHANPCGAAVSDVLSEAYRLARDGDPVSVFGGIVALNRVCDEATAALLVETFLECVAAPSFEEAALARLRQKKNLRLVAVDPTPATEGALELRRVRGGFAVQGADATGAGEVERGRVTSKRAPTAAERASLELAWRIAKHVKSNAIVLARGDQVVGVGAGQMSRVASVALACDKAAARAPGSVMASDAFFPFPDGVELAARHGVTAVAQPGGSVKDAEVLAAADAASMAMIFTDSRHFRH